MPNNQPPIPSSDDYPAMDIGSDDIAQIDNANNNNVDNEHDDDDELFTIRNRNRAGGSRGRPNNQAGRGSRSGVTECIDLTRGVTYQAPERSIADLRYGERARFLARRGEVLPNNDRSQANNRAAGSARREAAERIRRWNRGELTASDEERDRFLNASTDDQERELDRQLNARVESPDGSQLSVTPIPDAAPAAGPSRRRQALPYRPRRDRAGGAAEDDLQAITSGHNVSRPLTSTRSINPDLTSDRAEPSASSSRQRPSRGNRVNYEESSNEEEDPEFIPGPRGDDLGDIGRPAAHGDDPSQLSTISRLPRRIVAAARREPAVVRSAAREDAERRAAERRRAEQGTATAEQRVQDWRRDLNGVAGQASNGNGRAGNGNRAAAGGGSDREGVAEAAPRSTRLSLRDLVDAHPRRVDPPAVRFAVDDGAPRSALPDRADRPIDLAIPPMVDPQDLLLRMGRPGPGPRAARAGHFASAEEEREAQEAFRISRDLDRQEAAAAAAAARQAAVVPPRGGLGPGGAEAYGLEARMAGAGHRAGWLGLPFGAEGIMGGLLGGGLGLGMMMPGMFGMGYRGGQQGPSIEDMWKGVNYAGHRDQPRSGYAFDFDRENNEAGAGPSDIIRLDHDEDSPWTQGLDQDAERKYHKSHLVCAACKAPLRVSEGMRNEDDRVFALRCGHVVDSKCFDKISKPPTDIVPDEVLGEDHPGKTNGHDAASITGEGEDSLTATGSKRKRKAAASATAPTAKKATRGRSAKAAPEEYTWSCPVGDRCGATYKSLKRGGIWMPDPMAATQLFV